MLVLHTEGVERRINSIRTPKIHTDILLEYTFDSNAFNLAGAHSAKVSV